MSMLYMKVSACSVNVIVGYIRWDMVGTAITSTDMILSETAIESPKEHRLILTSGMVSFLPCWYFLPVLPALNVSTLSTTQPNTQQDAASDYILCKNRKPRVICISMKLCLSFLSLLRL